MLFSYLLDRLCQPVYRLCRPINIEESLISKLTAAAACFPASSIRTSAAAHIGMTEAGPTLTRIELSTEA